MSPAVMERESPIDRIAQSAANAVDDLNLAIWSTETRADLNTLRTLAERLIQQLEMSACVALTLDEHFDERIGR